MKKILSMLAVAAAFAVVACTPEDKPKDDGGDAKAPVAEFEYSVDGLSGISVTVRHPRKPIQPTSMHHQASTP